MPRKFHHLAQEEKLIVKEYVHDNPDAEPKLSPKQHRDKIADNPAFLAELVEDYRIKHVPGYGAQQELDYRTPEEKSGKHVDRLKSKKAYSIKLTSS